MMRFFHLSNLQATRLYDYLASLVLGDAGRLNEQDSERHKQIIDLLQETPFASVRDLQERLGVSPATIRRDIDKLHEIGSARKVYGGISANEVSTGARLSARPYDENRDIAVEAKRAIAEKAASLVRDGDSIIVHARDQLASSWGSSWRGEMYVFTQTRCL